MRADDFATVKKLIPYAFAALFTRETGRKQTMPPRTVAELASYLESDPAGCFSAVWGGKVVGCAFAHTWGDVGWTGPLAVHPDCQGRGIGKALLAAATDYLGRSGVRTIGLETMPQTVYNLGLYMKNGYQPGNLRLRYSKEIGIFSPAWRDDVGELVTARAAEIPALLPAVQAISDAIEPGLDYRKEVQLTYKYGLGEIFLLRRTDATVGFCLYHHLATRGRAIIKVLAVAPAAGNAALFGQFLAACELTLSRRGIQHLIAPIYGEYNEVCSWLLASGYSISNAGVRMFKVRKAGPPVRPDLIHLAQWSG